MTSVLGSATEVTTEDPFGPGDPVAVARLVRRALAAAGAKALDVTALLVCAGGPVEHAALQRFTRRALGPQGASLSPIAIPGRAATHQDCFAEATDAAIGFREGPPGGAGRVPARGSVVIAVALGPGAAATALCIGERRG